MTIRFDEEMMIAMARAMDMDEDTWAAVFAVSLAVFNEAQNS
jgi:hypothetical protein